MENQKKAGKGGKGFAFALLIVAVIGIAGYFCFREGGLLRGKGDKEGEANAEQQARNEMQASSNDNEALTGDAAKTETQGQVGDEVSTESVEPKELTESKESEEPKELVESKKSEESKESVESKELAESKESEESKESDEQQYSQEFDILLPLVNLSSDDPETSETTNVSDDNQSEGDAENTDSGILLPRVKFEDIE
ncbi:MAG: hypothetical protein E7295_02225 [Lachnospiraceae bacterium]|nr:hypothetical protein [Lachnospiraceae bacterium]